MKWFLMLLVLASCSSTKQTKPKSEFAVKVEMSPIQDAAYYDLEGSYSVAQDKCEVIWWITREKKKEKKNIFIKRVSSLSEAECEKDFQALLPLHRAVLNELFNDYPAETILGVSTGSLSMINKSESWNLVIAKASLAHNTLHKPTKSYNQLFVELLVETNAAQPLKALFAEFGLAIEVKSVEKVFTSRVKETKFKDQFAPTVQNKNVMTDAGMIWWQ